MEIGGIAQYGLLLAILSVLGVTLGAALTAWFVTQLPIDYFRSRKRHRLARNPVLALFLLVLKNLMALVFIITGIVMLFTPGQGLLTLLCGVLLADFPGKFAVERRLARVDGVLRSLNWWRRRRGVPPLLPPE